ncbi:MAG: hypothetical protein NT166_28450 [Candidatus Aminicenantes bacterium]|nr:hypothetical protein [Candidatus Aminicenantes bacterium]
MGVFLNTRIKIRILIENLSIPWIYYPLKVKNIAMLRGFQKGDPIIPQINIPVEAGNLSMPSGSLSKSPRNYSRPSDIFLE